MAPGKKARVAAAPPIVSELPQSLHFPVNSLEGRAPQVICRTALSKCPSHAAGYCLWHKGKRTYNIECKSDTPHQVLILRTSGQGMAFSFPKY